jgi:hypothetical protein
MVGDVIVNFRRRQAIAFDALDEIRTDHMPSRKKPHASGMLQTNNALASQK